MKHYIRFIKDVDRLAGPILRLFPPAVPINPDFSKCETMLVIRPGGMGDAALLLPSIKQLKILNPLLKIDVLCESRNRGVFDAVDFVERVLCYHDLRSLIAVCRSMYDIVVDTEQSHYLSSILGRLIPSGLTVGFSVNGRKRLFNKAIDYHQDQYEAEMFWDLFGSELGKGDFSWNFPYFKSATPRKSDQLWSIDGIARHIVCVFPGGTVRERLWPEKRWARIIDYIHSSGWQAVLLGGKMEILQNKRITTHCQTSDVLNMTGQLSLLDTTWLLRQSRLLVSTDSGILHIGVLCDTPTISLFGSGIASKWAPCGEKHTVLSLDLPCSPCTLFGETPPCPNGYRCMLGIDSGMVINSLAKVMDRG